MHAQQEGQVYPRIVKPGHVPFDPLKVAAQTERIACKNNKRKYTAFYTVGVYKGISTAYTVGCCLRCIFCWVDLSRDYPEKYGRFCSPDEVFEQLDANARAEGMGKLRISGGEPTIGKEHLLSVLQLIEGTHYLFILETNGLLFGADKSYAEEVSKFRNVYIRVSLKAGNQEGFQARTGAIGSFYELPYKAIEHLKDVSARFHVAAMSDKRLMPPNEREQMLQKVAEIDPALLPIEEETCDPYDTTILRLKEAGWYEKVFGKR